MTEQQKGEVRWIREHDQSRNVVVLVGIIEELLEELERIRLFGDQDKERKVKQ